MVKRAGPSITRIAVLLAGAVCACAQPFHVYVGQIGARSVLLAWGTTSGGGNTIGRDSVSHGHAQVRIAGRSQEADRNWAEIRGLEPDREYPYEVFVNGVKIGDGSVRTYPERAQKLTFFVIGDYGNNSHGQRRIAEAMWREFQKRSASDSPVRFVLTNGDNIYADLRVGRFILHSGDHDEDWEAKFFHPYAELLRHLPFCPTLGNHDGGDSENPGDLPVYLDNFFFPGNQPARWYRFRFANLAEFFALDSSDNRQPGQVQEAYAVSGKQFQWLKEAMPASSAPWKIPYFHHPPFTAGPRHAPSYDSLEHFVRLFEQSGVRIVFSGHEHNFQFSAQDQATHGILYVVSGAGGELRRGSVLRQMERAHIAGWAPQRHFLVVEIVNRRLSLTPVSYEPMAVRDPRGKPVTMPLVITLP